MKSHRLALLLLGAILVIGVGIMFLWGTPRVKAVYPEPGATTLPAGVPVRITFSRPMQASSVTAHLSTEPTLNGKWTEQADTLIFTPGQPWPNGITVTVHLQAGARSTGIIGLPMLNGRTWSFTTERPRLAYLWPSSGPSDIYALDPNSGQVERLTNTQGVLDFCISPDGLTIYYSLSNADGGADIYHLDRLTATATLVLECAQATCHAPRLSPKGDFLAYERIPMSQPGQIAFPQVWLLPLPQGAPVLAGDSANQTQSPRWSATGQLAYYDKTRQGFVIQDSHGGKADFFPNQTGEGGDWSPDGKFFIAPEIFYVPAGSDQPTATSHLISFNRLDGKTTDLTKDDNLEDTGPAFSPDGSSLAFARKYLDITRWTPGRQLWLMKSDGSGARQLTDNAFDNHYDFAWSQDNRRLAYVISNQAKPTDPPELWLVNADGNNPVQLVIGGYAPQWMP